MPSIRASRSICTPRAWPGLGSHSEYGKLVPTMNSVSHPAIICSLAFVPSSPIEPVSQGRSSGSASRPLSARATPQPRMSATCSTSSAASLAPWPISIATFSPALSTSEARRRSSSRGTTCGRVIVPPLKTAPCIRGGSEYSSSWMSAGTMTHVTLRDACATRKARSMMWRAAGAEETCMQNSEATSLNRTCRSTSCW